MLIQDLSNIRYFCSVVERTGLGKKRDARLNEKRARYSRHTARIAWQGVEREMVIIIDTGNVGFVLKRTRCVWVIK